MPAMLTRILPARRAQTSSLLSNSHHIRDAASAENGICWGEPCRRAALSPDKRGNRKISHYLSPQAKRAKLACRSIMKVSAVAVGPPGEPSHEIQAAQQLPAARGPACRN